MFQAFSHGFPCIFQAFSHGFPMENRPKKPKKELHTLATSLDADGSGEIVARCDRRVGDGRETGDFIYGTLW